VARERSSMRLLLATSDDPHGLRRLVAVWLTIAWSHASVVLEVKPQKWSKQSAGRRGENRTNREIRLTCQPAPALGSPATPRVFRSSSGRHGVCFPRWIEAKPGAALPDQKVPNDARSAAVREKTQLRPDS
jgi:hypothetical protein